MTSTFPSDWKELRLSDFGSCIRGVSYNPDTDLRERDTFDTVRLLRSNNVQDGSLELKSLQFVSATRVSPQQNMTSGDVLVCMANGSKQLVGKAARFEVQGNQRYTFGAFMGIFRPFNKIDSDFIYFLMQSKAYRNNLDIALSGSSINNLRPSNILEMTFVIPEGDERKKISNALADVDLLVRHLDRLISKKRDIKLGAMQQLLNGKKRLPGFSEGWLNTSIGKLGDLRKGRGIRKGEVRSHGLACVRYGEIYTRFSSTISSCHSFISDETARNSEPLLKGDVIFAVSGETSEEIGKCATFLGDFEAYVGSDTIVLRPRGNSPTFLGYFLNFGEVLAQKQNLGQGDAVVHLSQANLANITVTIPTLLEQEAIAEVLSDMDAEIDALVARRNKTALIKTGMMQELLTGRIRLL